MVTPLLHMIAAQSGSEGDWSEILVWSGVLIGLLLAGGVVVAIVKKVFVRTTDDANDHDFTLHGLRKMHANGLISDAEFEQARASIIDRATRPPEGEIEDPAIAQVRALRPREGRESSPDEPERPDTRMNDEEDDRKDVGP